MHIEINAGGIAAFGTINDLQDEFGTLIDRSTDILSAFKTVESRTVNLNGGVGKLAEAVDNIWQRIQKEEQRIEYAKDALAKAVEFGANTMRTDARVAEIVRSNKEEFYQMHPWLRPPVPETDDRNMFQKGWDLLKEGFREFGEAVGELYENVKDTLKKAWDTIVEFYKEHEKIIKTILAGIAIVAAAVALIALTPAALAALVPLLTALGVSAGTALTISSAVVITSYVTTIIANGMEIADIWLEIDNEVFEGFKTFFKVTSIVTSALRGIGQIFNAVTKSDPLKVLELSRQQEAVKITDVNQVDVKQYEALQRYSGHSYDNINASMRGMETATPENAEAIKTLKDTLGNSSYPESTVYRGTSLVELGEYQNLPPEELIGKTYSQSAFLSTSKNYVVANDWANDLTITIDVPSGAPGLDISSISLHPNEAEVLFNAGREFVITDAYREGGKTFIHTIMKP